MFIAHDPCLNIVQFQKVWYPWNQLIEIFQILPVTKKLRKKGAILRNSFCIEFCLIVEIKGRNCSLWSPSLYRLSILIFDVITTIIPSSKIVWNKFPRIIASTIFVTWNSSKYIKLNEPPRTEPDDVEPANILEPFSSSILPLTSSGRHGDLE